MLLRKIILVALSLYLGLLPSNAQEDSARNNWPEWIQVKFNMAPLFIVETPRFQGAIELPINEKISFFNEFGIAYRYAKPENETRRNQEYLTRAGFRRSFQDPMKSLQTWYLELFGHHHQKRTSVSTPPDMLPLTPALNPLNRYSYHESIYHFFGSAMSVGWQRRISPRSRIEASAAFGVMYRTGYSRTAFGLQGQRPLRFPSIYEGGFQFSHFLFSIDARYCFAFFPKGRS